MIQEKTDGTFEEVIARPLSLLELFNKLDALNGQIDNINNKLTEVTTERDSLALLLKDKDDPRRVY